MQCLVMFGKGSCWDLHWVLKPRQASKRPVVSIISFSNQTSFFLVKGFRTALWWQQLSLKLYQCRRDCVVWLTVCVSVCVCPEFKATI